MKIRSVETELFHTDRQADMTKLTVAFRRFVNAPRSAGYESQQTNYKYSAVDCN